MKFLKCVVSSPDYHRGHVEFFNLSQVLNIQPSAKYNEAKILMGAGLYWQVYLDSMEIVEINSTEDLLTMNWEV